MCNGHCHEAIDKYNNKLTIRMRDCCNLFALFERFGILRQSQACLSESSL
jgi:hypothetical protein